MFTKAIVKKPGRSLVRGITTAQLGLPNYDLALNQHAAYTKALEECGLEIITLEADEAFPDSTFVEDTALLTPHCAIITNPGAPSRQGEITAIKQVLVNHYTQIEEIKEPGKLEAGDIMIVGSHYYIGLSERTNEKGAEQLIGILERYGMSGSIVTLKEMLHLKTGVAYLENNNLLAYGEFITKDAFKAFNILEIAADESYAANCIWVNDTVIMPAGYPKTKEHIKNAGYAIKEVDVSEFKKLDGGLSCLSLRF